MVKKPGELPAGILFFFYMSAFMTALTFADTRAAALLADAAALWLHYVDYLFLFAGLLGCSLLSHRLSVQWKKLLLALAGSLYLLGLLWLGFSKQILLPATALLSLSLGVMGALAYFLIAVNLSGSRRMGLVMAVSSSAAALVQWLADRFSLTFPALLLLGAAGTALAWVLALRKTPGPLKWTLPGQPECTALTGPSKKWLLSILVIILCLEMISGFNDGFYVRLFSQGDVDLYGWPRLLLIPAFLLSGVLADFRGGRYFPVSVVCVFMLSVFAPIFLIDKRFYLLNLCLFYPYSAFLVSYVNLSFWRLAPTSGRPELVAPMGRIIDCGTSILFSFWHAETNFLLCIVIQLLLLTAAWAMLLFQNQLRSTEAMEAATRRRTLNDYLSAFDLTDKERECAEIVMTRNIDIKELSDIIYVSERGTYRLMKQVYEKIGTDSRTGLLLQYSSYLAGGETPHGT